MLLSPKQLYKTLEEMNDEYQAQQTYEQDKDDPSEGTPWRGDYIAPEDREELEVTNIPF